MWSRFHRNRFLTRYGREANTKSRSGIDLMLENKGGEQANAIEWINRKIGGTFLKNRKIANAKDATYINFRFTFCGK